jgi:hypothetical protein
MGVLVVPAATGGGIKSVQRGLAGASGTVTITAVDIAKSFVTVFGTTSTGAVAGSGTVAAGSGSTGIKDYGTNNTAATGGSPSASISYNSTTISAGTTTLVSAVIQGYLSNSTSLIVSGACRWEVVEFA